MEKEIEKLIELRPFILWMELAGLLHDIGKLSRLFIEYRTKWQERIDGRNWYNDPHQGFLDSEKPLIEKYHPDLNKALNLSLRELLEDWRIKDEWDKKFKDNLPLAENYNLYDYNLYGMVREHESAHSPISALLRASDSKDSAIDRNNPLLVGEQKDIGSIFFSTVFGHEEKIDVSKLEEERKNLFNFLNARLPDYLTGKDRFKWDGREKILDKLREHLRKGLADTCRPVNDILLWEHGYATATILKVLVAHFILTGQLLDDFGKVRFSIIGVGWDGMAYYSQGEKMADISAKKDLMENLKEAIRQIVEYDIPTGNMIYHDDDGIYFLLPPRVSRHENAYNAVIEKIRMSVQEKVAKITDDEIQPVFEIEPDTKFLTAIVKVIERIKEKAAFPYRAEDKHLSLAWKDKWKDIAHICPICQKRPARKEGKICGLCLERRKKAQQTKNAEEETLFIDDIADKYERVCLILCNFELREWLNGNMIRTLMVKEPHILAEEIKRLGEIKGFKEEEIKQEKEKKLEIVRFRKIDLVKYLYHRDWLDDIRLCEEYPTISDSEKRYTEAVFGLYDRRKGKIEAKNWAEWLDEAKEEHRGSGYSISMAGVLLTKTPTPSRIFRVWNETEQFFADHLIRQIKTSIGTKKRIRLDLSKPEVLSPFIIYDDVEVLGTRERISLIREEDDKVFVIGKEYRADLYKEWQGKTLRIPSTEETTVMGVAEGGEFHPFRTIIISPNLFMALVPAESTLEISKRIHEKYIERMGKVTGRLPFAIANIFFPRKMPMFAILDTARRLRTNFRNISKHPGTFEIKKEIAPNELVTIPVEADKDLIDVKFSQLLGNKEKDYYYPYFIVKDKGDLEEKFYLDTPMGIATHWDGIYQKSIHNYVNLYDFEFIDSSTRRLFVSRLSGNKRHHILLKDKGLRPYLLEQLDQLLMKIWKELKEAKVTDTQIKGLESLLGQKFLEWQMWSGDNGKQKVWKEFVQSATKLHLEKAVGKDDFIFEVTKRGALFDCLELYLKIMKEKLEEGV